MAFLIVAATLITNCVADICPGQPGIKILKYSFDVALGDESDQLSVRDTIDVQLSADGVAGIDLDLCQLVISPRVPIG